MSHVRSIAGAAAGLGALLLFVQPVLAAYKSMPSQGIDLSGRWQLNAALSDDAEALLQKRLDEERKERAAWERRAREAGVLMPPPDVEANGEAPPPPQPDRNRRSARERYLDTLRQMLGISNTLQIAQSGTTVQIVSEVDSRRFEAGSRSQVSMPQGELADSDVGWDGEWFVIERKASRGPRVVEKYRWLKKTDQLESRLAWSGDSPLAGIKVKRIYDRVVGAVAPPNAELGPVK